MVLGGCNGHPIDLHNQSKVMDSFLLNCLVN